MVIHHASTHSSSLLSVPPRTPHDGPGSPIMTISNIFHISRGTTSEGWSGTWALAPHRGLATNKYAFQ